MKKILTIISILVSASAMTCKAQDKPVRSLYAGASMSYTEFFMEDGIARTDGPCYNLGYFRTKSAFGLYCELTAGKAKTDQQLENGSSNYLSAAAYLTFKKGTRFQYELSPFGFGVTYLSSSPNSFLSFAAQAKALYYLTPNFAVYAKCNAGVYGRATEKNLDQNDLSYGISLGLGLAVSF